MSSRFTYPVRLAALHPTRHQAQVFGSDTVWWDYPVTDTAPASSDTVIAIHGFRGDHHGLELFAAFWPEQHLIIPDLPAFGESGAFADQPHSIDSYAEWLLAFVEQVSPNSGRVSILGHSFGSIVVSAALARGLRVDAAILVNPISAPALEGPRGMLTQGAIAYYRLGAALPERLGHAWLSNWAVVRTMSVAMAKSPEPELRKFIHEQHDRYFSTFANRDALLEGFRTSVSNDVSEFAADIHVPVLLIVAERDDITPLEAQFALAEQLESADLRVIPRVGHLVHYETPAVAVEHMRDFLAKLT